MEIDVDPTESELRRSDRPINRVTRLTYRQLKVQYVKNMARYDHQMEILICRIIYKINCQGYEKRKQKHVNSFVEPCTLSQGINKFGEKGYDSFFVEENQLYQRV